MKKLIFTLILLFPLFVIGQTYTPVQGNKYYKGFSKFAKKVTVEDTLRISAKGIKYADGTIGNTGFQSGDTVALWSVAPLLSDSTIMYVTPSQMKAHSVGRDSLYIGDDGYVHIVINGQDIRLAKKDSTVVTNYNATYQAVYNAMTNKPSSTIAEYQNTLVADLIAANAWSTFDWFMVAVQYSNNAGEANINWISPGTNDATDGASTAWTSLEGYTGDGSTDYINTNFNAATDATHYTQNSVAVGVYLRLNIAEDAYVIGNGDFSVVQSSIFPRGVDGSAYGRANHTSGNLSASGITDSRGLWVVTRTTSDSTQLSHKGSIISSTGYTGSDAISSSDFSLLTRDIGTFSTNQISIAFIGGKLTAGQLLLVDTAIEKYMDAIGNGV